MPDGGRYFSWHPKQANPEGKFHDLLEAGAKAFRVLWI
jgi:hypothetical protein